MDFSNWAYFFMGVGVLTTILVGAGSIVIVGWFFSQNRLSIILTFSVLSIMFLNGMWFGLRLSGGNELIEAAAVQEGSVPALDLHESMLFVSLNELKQHAIEERWLVFPEDIHDQSPPDLNGQMLLRMDES